MIQLSIDFINQKSNYNVVLSPYGELDFITDYGVKYTISFVTEEYVGGCETYQFVIKRKKIVFPCTPFLHQSKGSFPSIPFLYRYEYRR